MADWTAADPDRHSRLTGLDLRTDIPHSARIYDYLLGGKDNFPADRAVAHEMVRDAPHTAISMRANRNFMARVGRHLAAEQGIRQFLDVGTGLPSEPNLHQVVQEIAPESRVVYVDNDPIVLAHARALLYSTKEGRTSYIDADLRDPDAILGSQEVRDTLDLSKPVAVSLIAVVHFIVDDDDARRVVDRLLEPLVPGSVLALSTITADGAEEEINGFVATSTARGVPVKARGKAEVERFFAGLDLMDPGVIRVNRWHPEGAMLDDAYVHMYGGVAVKR